MVAKTKDYETRFQGARMLPFEDLDEPGTYFCNWSGHLIRVPEEGVKKGRSPIIEIVGRDPIFVTKLSDDPFLPLTKARMIAADLDHAVNF